MFIEGFINDSLEPIINNFFIVAENENIPIKAILDTGFNGSCSLPREFFNQISLQPFGNTKYELANGQIIYEKTFVSEIILGNIPYFIEISFTDSDTALIGMALIKDKIATFDLKKMIFHVEN